MTAPVRVARKMELIQESITLKIHSAAQDLRAKGLDIANLTAGEPDFAVPDAVKEAAIEAVRANRSRYTPAAGIPELREAVARKTNDQQPRGGRWAFSDVIVSNGGKQALFNAMLALLDPGDEVLIPSPYWLSYPDMVKLAGGIPKFIWAPAAQGFKITPAQLKAAIGPKVKLLILNSPCNPTGAVYTEAEFAALGEVLLAPEASHICVLSDEIYDRIILGKTPFCSFLKGAPALKDRTVTVNGLSKSAAMTGWRIGWSVACAPITRAILTIQGQSTSGINSLAQWASLAALALPEAMFQHHIESYRNRRDLALEFLEKLSKIEVSSPEGAFYLFIGIGKYLREGEDSVAFAERILEEANVAVVPGSPFGDPESIRLSFSGDERSLMEGCRRIASYLQG
ncbi:MAG: hypothetical protein A2603_15030 [Bdellovibrionales bacterium RIFOXYD1_FULL_55_31]|nr:MAG: hypothetical protein A2603_15030 [Bdellovibrionales bacterium RIFOXYD1_FULL_55_31]